MMVFQEYTELKREPAPNAILEKIGYWILQRGIRIIGDNRGWLPGETTVLVIQKKEAKLVWGIYNPMAEKARWN